MEIVINDESVANDYGFYVSNAGIDLTRYRNNNVLLYAHNGSRLAIGNVNDITIKGTKMVGTVSFDEEDTDPDVQRLISKYKRGVQKGFSMGIMVNRFEERGQKNVAVESELYEVSCETLQSNKNAVTVKLMNNDDSLYQLGYNRNEKIFLHNNKSEAKQMKKVAMLLGLQENANESDFEQAITKLKSVNIELVINVGKQKGVVNSSNEAAFKALLSSNYDAAKSIIDAANEPMPPHAPIANLTTALKELEGNVQVAGNAKNPNDRENWTFEDWQKKDSNGLVQMRMNEPDKFRKLYSAFEASKK